MSALGTVSFGGNILLIVFKVHNRSLVITPVSTSCTKLLLTYHLMQVLVNGVQSFNLKTGEVEDNNSCGVFSSEK